MNNEIYFEEPNKDVNIKDIKVGQFFLADHDGFRKLFRCIEFVSSDPRLKYIEDVEKGDFFSFIYHGEALNCLKNIVLVDVRIATK